MGDFWSSVLEYFKARVKSQVYGIFAFWWIVLHFNYFTALLLVDQQLIYSKTGLLKDEYLYKTYLNLEEPTFWLSLIATIVLTFLTIYLFPKIFFNPSYKIEKKYQYERKRVKFQHDKEVERLRTAVTSQEVKKLDEELKKEKRTETLAERRESGWRQEYERFRKSTLFSSFEEIKESVYERFGYIKVTSEGNIVFSIDPDLLAYAHANDLIKMDTEEQVISLTEKGKYFMKRYQLEVN